VKEVTSALGVDKIDTMILSLPGITLEKDEEDYNSKVFPVTDKTRVSWVETWKVYRLVSTANIDTRVVADFWQSDDSWGLRVRHHSTRCIPSTCRNTTSCRSDQSARLLRCAT
jgi:cation diffusion facilitator CzcD-associated flavoprotein CzcO